MIRKPSAEAAVSSIIDGSHGGSHQADVDREADRVERLTAAAMIGRASTATMLYLLPAAAVARKYFQ